MTSKGSTYGVSTSLKKKKHIELCLKWRTVLQIRTENNIIIILAHVISYNIAILNIQYFVIHLNENRLKHKLDCILEADQHHLSLKFFLKKNFPNANLSFEKSSLIPFESCPHV